MHFVYDAHACSPKKIEATPIAPQLYQGSVPPSGTSLRDARFSMLVLAAKEHQPRSDNFPGVQVVYAPMRDSFPTSLELETARRASMMVSDEIRRGGKVLVTCIMGRNRSGLIMAMALRNLFGFSGKQAVSMIKTLRPLALTNSAFVEILNELPPTGRR